MCWHGDDSHRIYEILANPSGVLRQNQYCPLLARIPSMYYSSPPISFTFESQPYHVSDLDAPRDSLSTYRLPYHHRLPQVRGLHFNCVMHLHALEAAIWRLHAALCARAHYSRTLRFGVLPLFAPTHHATLELTAFPFRRRPPFC